MEHSSPSHYIVEVQLPREAFVHHPWSPEQIAKKLRILWLIEQVRERRLAYGKAAELAGIPKASFVQLMAQHQVSPVDYDPDESKQEFETADRLSP